MGVTKTLGMNVYEAVILHSFGNSDFALQSRWKAILRIGQFEPYAKGAACRVNHPVHDDDLSRVHSTHRSFRLDRAFHSDLH